jgi:sirohydrochlorin cobaltochelatase
MKSGLLLFGHGARDPAWSRPFESVAERCRAQLPDVEVELAFLEFMTPDLPGAGARLVERGCLRVKVVPLFLGVGGHVRKDIPVLMAALRESHPAVTWLLGSAIGDNEAVIAAMAAAASASLATDE